MSISATSCNGYRALGVSGAPNNPGLVSIFAWAKSTADASAYRNFFAMQDDTGIPVPGIRLGTGGSDGVNLRAASAGTMVLTQDGAQYFYTAGIRNTWVPVAGWIDGSASSADGSVYFNGIRSNNTTDNLPSDVITGLLDQFYVLSNGYVGNGGWGGQAESSSANLRVAHVAVWVGYKLTDADMTALGSGTNPMDIGGGPDWYWPLVTLAGDGLVDDVAGVTLEAYGGTATWHDADNPTVSAPSGGGNAAPTFPGPNIGNQTGTVGVALTPLDVSDEFYDTDALTFSAVGSWPPGVTVSSAGVISGTPTTAGTYASLKVRATDTAAQTVDSDTFSFTISAAGTITITDVYDFTTGAPKASQTGVTVFINNPTTGALVVKLTGQTTTAGADMTITDAALVFGTDYDVTLKFADGSRANWMFTAT